jgi:acetyltransferase-like isoleucine patch superfamily enzyme
MSILRGYLPWVLWRRQKLRWSTPGFSASVFSYADSRCRFESGSKLSKGACLYDTHLGMGSYTLARMIRVRAGRFCSIGRAEIGGQSKHPTMWLSTHPAFYSARPESGISFVEQTLFAEEAGLTRVGNDVWIGHGAVVMEGCEIGDGAVVSASAVVTKNVEPYAIMVGAPAKAIGYRFSPTVVAALLDWQWWKLPEADLRRLAPEFTATDNWTLDRVNAIRERCRDSVS